MYDTEKFIHISDILSFYTGTIMSETKELKAPDGTVKPAWETMMAPIIHVAEAVTGQSFWIDREEAVYDGFKLAMMKEGIRSALEERLPWIREYRNAPETPQGDPKETEDILADWVNGIAAKHGAWHRLGSEAPAPQARTAPKPARFDKKNRHTP